MTGKNLLPAIQNDSTLVYQTDEPIGIEAAGHSALFKGDFKLTRNARPLGDFKWRLYNLKNDPGETNDLAQAQPQLFAEIAAKANVKKLIFHHFAPPPDFRVIKNLYKKELKGYDGPIVFSNDGDLFIVK